MKLAGYIRVSTEGQIDAFGKEVQREAIVRWADLNDHSIIAWYEEDGVSGTTDGGDRPMLSMLLLHSETMDFEGMVAFDASRLARRSVVQETLLGLVWSAGLKVFTTTAGEISETDDPTRILIRQILGVIAEFDHRNTVKRLQAGRRHAMAAGRYGGGITPFGVKAVGTGKSAQLVDDEVESQVINEILALRAEGTSLRAIATVLNGTRHRTKMGKLWSAEQVRRVLARCENV